MTKTALAAEVGVARQTLHDWEAEGCPMDSADAIREWRANHKLPRRGVALEPGETLQGRLLEAQIWKHSEDARNRKMKNDQLAGQLYDAQEVERNVAELTSVIRARLESIPDELGTEFPAELRLQLRQRLEDHIRLILTQMSQWQPSWLTPDKPAPDEGDEPTDT